MRCPDCNKFVGLENGDLEADLSVESDGDKGTVTGTVRVVRNCAECGQELKEANFDVDESFDIPEAHRGEDHDLDVEVLDEEVTESGGGRYAKNNVGYSLTAAVTCNCEAAQKAGEPVAEIDLADSMPAGQFDELV